MVERIIVRFISRQAGDEVLPLELIYGERRGTLRQALVVADIEVGILRDGDLDIVRIDLVTGLEIGLLEVDTHTVARRDDEAVEHVGRERDERRRDHIRAEQTAEAHPTGEHGDDLGVRCELRGEEDHRDEDEERTEEVRVVGDEVEIVAEEDPRERHLWLEEVRDLIVDVEDHCDREDQADGEEERRDEGTYDVPVHPPQPRAVRLLHHGRRRPTLGRFGLIYLIGDRLLLELFCFVESGTHDVLGWA